MRTWKPSTLRACPIVALALMAITLLAACTTSNAEPPPQSSLPPERDEVFQAGDFMHYSLRIAVDSEGVDARAQYQWGVESDADGRVSILETWLLDLEAQGAADRPDHPAADMQTFSLLGEWAMSDRRNLSYVVDGVAESLDVEIFSSLWVPTDIEVGATMVLGDLPFAATARATFEAAGVELEVWVLEAVEDDIHAVFYYEVERGLLVGGRVTATEADEAVIEMRLVTSNVPLQSRQPDESSSPPLAAFGVRALNGDIDATGAVAPLSVNQLVLDQFNFPRQLRGGEEAVSLFGPGLFTHVYSIGWPEGVIDVNVFGAVGVFASARAEPIGNLGQAIRICGDPSESAVYRFEFVVETDIRYLLESSSGIYWDEVTWRNFWRGFWGEAEPALGMIDDHLAGARGLARFLKHLPTNIAHGRVGVIARHRIGSGSDRHEGGWWIIEMPTWYPQATNYRNARGESKGTFTWSVDVELSPGVHFVDLDVETRLWLNAFGAEYMLGGVAGTVKLNSVTISWPEGAPPVRRLDPPNEAGTQAAQGTRHGVVDRASAQEAGGCAWELEMEGEFYAQHEYDGELAFQDLRATRLVELELDEDGAFRGTGTLTVEGMVRLVTGQYAWDGQSGQLIGICITEIPYHFVGTDEVTMTSVEPATASGPGTFLVRIRPVDYAGDLGWHEIVGPHVLDVDPLCPNNSTFLYALTMTDDVDPVTGRWWLEPLAFEIAATDGATRELTATVNSMMSEMPGWHNANQWDVTLRELDCPSGGGPSALGGAC